MTIAWLTVNLMATTLAKGRIPELRTLLAGAAPARAQTKAEQKANLATIFGAERMRTKHDRARRDA